MFGMKVREGLGWRMFINLKGEIGNITSFNFLSLFRKYKSIITDTFFAKISNKMKPIIYSFFHPLSSIFPHSLLSIPPHPSVPTLLITLWNVQVKRNNFIDYIIFQWETTADPPKIMNWSPSTDSNSGCTTNLIREGRSAETGEASRQLRWSDYMRFLRSMIWTSIPFGWWKMISSRCIILSSTVSQTCALSTKSRICLFSIFLSDLTIFATSIEKKPSPYYQLPSGPSICWKSSLGRYSRRRNWLASTNKARLRCGSIATQLSIKPRKESAMSTVARVRLAKE